MSLYLCHHGIKGQKWGVRRYQNPDGTLTQAGKDRAYIYKTDKYVEDIDNTMTYDEKKRMGFSDPDNPQYTRKELSELTVKRFLIKEGKTPVAYLDIMEEEDSQGKYTNFTIGVRNDEKYRGKGYAKQLAKQGADWVKESKIKDSFWLYRADNIASEKTAKSAGFKLTDEFDYTDDEGHKWKAAYLKN